MTCPRRFAFPSMKGKYWSGARITVEDIDYRTYRIAGHIFHYFSVLRRIVVNRAYPHLGDLARVWWTIVFAIGYWRDYRLYPEYQNEYINPLKSLIYYRLDKYHLLVYYFIMQGYFSHRDQILKKNFFFWTFKSCVIFNRGDVRNGRFVSFIPPNNSEVARDAQYWFVNFLPACEIKNSERPVLFRRCAFRDTTSPDFAQPLARRRFAIARTISRNLSGVAATTVESTARSGLLPGKEGKKKQAKGVCSS